MENSVEDECGDSGAETGGSDYSLRSSASMTEQDTVSHSPPQTNSHTHCIREHFNLEDAKDTMK
ncbi:hypothetical protein DNTS_005426 [Danionella cerebrum]|uniref:Uncharacterized protein n=1 Tax=Danionella cerebrum TaxID=2873325 RepID=A0A553RKN8_9TELE|nr:hypothetical protein DNTS_005426 [Danionella translucida]